MYPRKKSQRDPYPLYKRRPGGFMSRMKYDEEVEEDWVHYLVPKQTKEVLPKETEDIPRVFRQRVYELLINWFPDGVDIETFTEAYNARWGHCVSADNECGLSLGMALSLMADIVDMGTHKVTYRTWIRPMPYDYVKLYLKEKELKEFDREQLFAFLGGPPIIEKKKKKNPQPDMKTQEGRDAVANAVRAEVQKLLAPFDDGIIVENLAINYGYRYPGRGITRQEHEMLREWLKAMPDIVDVYEEDEDDKGTMVWYAKLKMHGDPKPQQQ